jgi:nitroimidazol reductase NimA-like FMN-containing flavoprotein (pyridoxamine 5'-phosphate oxidase superfamily)
VSNQYDVDKTNKVRQLSEKASYDTDKVHAILDSALVISAGFVQDGQAVVVPMIHGREDETIYLHGARKARVIRLLEETQRVCLNATHVDGIVFARSAFNSSMNYRSVTVFGNARLVEDYDDKVHGMRVISEHVMPGRWDELREPLEKEVKMTGVIAVDIPGCSMTTACSTVSGLPTSCEPCRENSCRSAPWARQSRLKPLLQQHVAVLRLKPQQRFLGIQPTTKPCQIAAAADDAMAWDDNRDRVATVRRADRAHGPGPADAFCDITIGRRLTVRNLLQRFQYQQLEFSARQVQGQIEFLARSCEVLFELPARFDERLLVEDPVRLGVMAHLPLGETDQAQAIVVACKKQIAYRCSQVAVVHHSTSGARQGTPQ